MYKSFRNGKPVEAAGREGYALSLADSKKSASRKRDRPDETNGSLPSAAVAARSEEIGRADYGSKSYKKTADVVVSSATMGTTEQKGKYKMGEQSNMLTRENERARAIGAIATSSKNKSIANWFQPPVSASSIAPDVTKK